jgi:MinD superfamily P-loop ATPase
VRGAEDSKPSVLLRFSAPQSNQKDCEGCDECEDASSADAVAKGLIAG